MRLKRYFSQQPLKQGTFNRYRPAYYLAENIAGLGTKLDAATLERFENAFKTVNKLL